MEIKPNLAETYWKTYLDFPLKQEKKKIIKSIYPPGKSFFQHFFGVASNDNPNHE